MFRDRDWYESLLRSSQHLMDNERMMLSEEAIVEIQTQIRDIERRLQAMTEMDIEARIGRLGREGLMPIEPFTQEERAMTTDQIRAHREEIYQEWIDRLQTTWDIEDRRQAAMQFHRLGELLEERFRTAVQPPRTFFPGGRTENRSLENDMFITPRYHAAPVVEPQPIFAPLQQAMTFSQTDARQGMRWIRADEVPRTLRTEVTPVQVTRGNMRITQRVTSALTETEIKRLKEFYLTVLKGTSAVFPLENLVLYVDKQAKFVRNGHFQVTDTVLYVGKWPSTDDRRYGTYLNEMQSLAVIGTLMGITGFADEPEVVDTFVKATGRAMHGVLMQTMEGFIEGAAKKDVTSKQMAFHKEKGIAAKIGDVWRYPSSALAQVETEEGWTVIEM